MASRRAPGYTNRADKNSNIITLVTSSAMFRHIKGILRHIQGSLRHMSHIRTYSEPCVTLAYTTVSYVQKACETCKMIRPIQSPGINRTGFTLRILSEYSVIFMDIDAYSVTLTGLKLGGVGKVFPTRF